jgi:hypothetical protein
MSLLEGLEPPKKHHSCLVATLLTTLDPADVESLKTALADERRSHTGLANALAKRGIEISRNPVLRHRTGLCSCSKI